MYKRIYLIIGVIVRKSAAASPTVIVIMGYCALATSIASAIHCAAASALVDRCGNAAGGLSLHRARRREVTVTGKG